MLTWPKTNMKVIGTDQMSGRCYKCACGARRWSCWGNARKHHEKCEHAHNDPCDTCGKPIVGEKLFKVTGMSRLGIRKTCQECAGHIIRGVIPKQVGAR